jgi:hypothetical protein
MGIPLEDKWPVTYQDNLTISHHALLSDLDR